MELWQAGRKVKRWEAATTMPLAPIGDPFISTVA
jgi:hypothetical protein